MSTPMVSFVVPCYKLAHLLPECIHSILEQTFGDYEILIMDDCSPDDTATVARSFGDPRVIHVRNDPNLGHLRNYNKGIDLARGKYIWLISADDYLRRPQVLARYVDLMERRPAVGYAFCAGVGVKDGQETDVLAYSRQGARDWVLPGRRWIKTILRQNVVLAASGLVRRECYRELGTFPLDMPWAGDWYLWCLFSLYGEVAYFSDPMVCYREHQQSMTSHLTLAKAAACCEEEAAIPWRIKARADAAGLGDVSRACLRSAVRVYANCIGRKRFGMETPVMDLEWLERSLGQSPSNDRERRFVRSRVLEALGSIRYWQGDASGAQQLYREALGLDPWMGATRVKQVLTTMGRPGRLMRRLLTAKFSGSD